MAETVTEASAIAAVEVRPDDPRYADFQMRGYNRRFIGVPRSVQVVHDTAQVQAAVEAAVRAGRRIAVRGGGHCLEDFVDAPDVEVVIEMSEMDAVHYDPRMRAFAAEGGATLGRVYKVLDLGWGLTLPGGSCPAVGVGGHVSGGGNGALSRLHGHISDHLYAVEIVVVGADGRAETVVATREPDDPNRDLWWAHTGGGGGNFGVVTKFWFRSPDAVGDDPATLLPRRPSRFLVATAMWQWADLDRESFGRLSDNFMQWCARNADPQTPTAALHGELVAFRQDHGMVVVMGRLDPASGSRDLLDAFMAEMTAGMPRAEVVVMDEPWLYNVLNVPNPATAFGLPPSSLRSKLKAAYLKKPMDGDQVTTLYRNLRDPDYTNPASAAILSSWGGRINAVPSADTATAQRDSIMLLAVVNCWAAAEEDERHLDWLRAFYRDIFATTGGVPVPNDATDGSYINWPDSDLADPRWNTSEVPWSTLFYGANYPRLQRIKARWDPRGVFEHALSIQPTENEGA